MALTKVTNSMINGAVVNVLDFGAIADGSNDDTQAIENAIAFCQTNLASLYFPAGIYKITSTITLSGSNTGITFIGDGFGNASWQQGSVRPATTLRWTGGASPMFTVAGTMYRFIGMAVENFGSATDFLNCTTAMHMLLENLSFEVGAGATRFSRSVINTEGNWLGYTKIINCQIVSPASRFIKIDGQGTGNGITTIQISECVVDTYAAAPMSFIEITDETIDVLTINNNTFNLAGNAELTVIEATATPAASVINALNITNNEFDAVTNDPSSRFFRLTNCPNVRFVGNQIQAGGVINRFAELTNSTVTQCESNHVTSLDGPLFFADATSRVYASVNYLIPGISEYLVNNTAAASGMIEMPYGTDVIVKGGLGVGTGTTVYRVEATNATPFTLNIAKPGDATNPSYMTRGQVFCIMVKNTSGGAITINIAADLKLNGGAFPVPADGFSRTVTFVWDGTNAVEIGRTASDVPN